MRRTLRTPYGQFNHGEREDFLSFAPSDAVPCPSPGVTDDPGDPGGAPVGLLRN
jgi:hypothetical protein